MPRLKTPTFLYIGMPKAGSTWIFEMLRRHPQVFVPPAKDIKFFDDNYHRGQDWYSRFFDAGADETAIGELSHDYYSVPEAAERIHRTLPNVKLICCLREPGDFVVSAYAYSRMHSLDDTTDFAAYAGSIAEGSYLRYVDNLRRFYRLFPASNILVLFYDDMLRSPDRFLAALYGFLGVRDDVRPPGYDERVNATRPPRWIGLTRLAYAAARGLRSLGQANLVGVLKSNAVLQRLLYSDAKRPPAVDAAAIADIRAACRKDFRALEELIGRPLPPAWHQGE